MHVRMQTMSTYLATHLSTYLHTYIHTYTHTYIFGITSISRTVSMQAKLEEKGLLKGKKKEDERTLAKVP